VARSSGTGQRLGSLLLVSAAAGLVLAAVLLPVVGGLGLVAKAGATQFEQLPDELKAPPVAVRSKVLAADGSTLARFYYRNRITVDSLRDIAPSMQQAIIAIEDARFYRHGGVDPKGIARAAWADATNGAAVQGASTITQQYVRYVLVEKAGTKTGQRAARAGTISRKLREARYAVALENRLSKRQILLRYLNIAYFGDGAYGVATAARHYFGVSASKLSISQSALLAGLVQNPTAFDPRTHPDAARARRDTVLRRMREQRMITGTQYRQARDGPVRLHLQKSKTGCEQSSAPFFCDYVVARFRHNQAFGATSADRRKLLLRGGLTIRTTLDPKVEMAARKAVTSHVDHGSRYVAGEAVVQPGTGKVKAISVSRPYGSGKGHTHVDYAVNKAYGGSRGFQAGSTFKMFVLTAALQAGVPLGHTIYAPAFLPESELGHGFVNCHGKQQQYRNKGHGVHNAGDSESGVFTLRQATVHSVNTYYVQLEQRIGTCKPFQVAKSMGVTYGNGKPVGQDPSFTLGTYEVSPMTMASAFATLAAKGMYCPPHVITSVTASSGKKMDLPSRSCQRVIPAGLAATVSHVLAPVLTRGTASGHSIGRPAAGKTGTTDGQTSAWFTGYTPRLASSVVYVDPDAPQQHPAKVYGGDTPAAIWEQTMRAALAGTKPKHFGALDKQYVMGRKIKVPDVTGQHPDDAKDALHKAGLSPQVADGTVDSDQPAGTVDHTSPSATARVLPGATVTIFVSNGVSPSPSPTDTPTISPPGPDDQPGAPGPPPDRLAPSATGVPSSQGQGQGGQQGHGHGDRRHGHHGEDSR
jgi:membrane peptidoglycan carboxypeptidase